VRGIALARESNAARGDLQSLVPALAIGALVAQAQGHWEAALNLVAEMNVVTQHSAPWRTRHMPTALRVLIDARELDLAEDFLAGIDVTATRDVNCVLTGRAILAESKRKLDEACDLYQEVVQRWPTTASCLRRAKPIWDLPVVSSRLVTATPPQPLQSTLDIRSPGCGHAHQRDRLLHPIKCGVLGHLLQDWEVTILDHELARSLITTAEAARRLEVSRERVLQLLEGGVLVGFRIEGLDRARFVDLSGEGTQHDRVLVTVQEAARRFGVTSATVRA